MAYFEWTPDMDVSVPSMNDEHKMLISLMDRINELGSAGAGKAQLEVAIEQLAVFTRRHFRREEDYMRSIGYPSLQGHAIIHGQLLKTLDAEIAAFRAGPGRFSQSFRDFLKHWLSAHIKGIDTKYGSNARPAGTKRAEALRKP